VKYCDACRASYPTEFSTCPKDQSVLRSITELLPGMVVRGKYQILEKIGAGGMGAVYKARHTAFGETRAIKLVASQFAADSSFLARFRAEAVVARRLAHPNAVRVEDLDTTENGLPFIVMEYVEGTSLRSVLAREGALPATRAVEIARQTCAALAAAHQLGVVHRDIKPDNLLLADGGATVKVLDFGLAKVKDGFDLGADQVATQTGRVLGTPQYMSPEQAMGRRGDEIDGRSDLYSLGVVVYEMLTGILPFRADSAMSMLLQHIQQVPTPPDAMRADLAIPRPLGQLVMKALEKDPNARFATAAEMGDALAAIATMPLPAARPRGPASAPTSPEAPTLLQPRATPPATAAAASRVAVAPHSGARTAALPRGERTARQPAPAASAAAVARTARVTLPQPERSASSASFLLWTAAGIATLVVGVAMSRRSGPHAPQPTPSATPATVPAAAPPEPAPEAATQPAGGSDPEIRAELQRVFFASDALREASLRVDVTNGIVTLSGEVPSAAAGELAASLAGSVRGVRRVFNMASPPPPAAAQAAAGAAATAPAETAEALVRPSPLSPGIDSEVRRLLGDARRLIESGDHSSAEQLFDAVLKIDPTNAIALDALQRLRERRPPPPHGRPPRPPR
jgi:serine/threonine protein kinase